MPHAVSSASPGLQALIFCGPGSSFPTFTANPDENPKALLPIANRPMVWYPLDFCYRAGITDITLICPPSAEKAIASALSLNPALTGLPLPRPTLLAPKDLDQNTGTAEILRLPEVTSAITGHFMILPCDLICEVGGDQLLQTWMVNCETLRDLVGNKYGLISEDQGPHSGGMGVWYQTKTETPVKGEETDFIATTPLPASATAPKDSLSSNMSKLVYSTPADSLNDLMEEKKGFPLRHGLIRQHPRIQMRTTHRDAHIYIFPRWILDFIQENDRLDSIGEDVIGWWAKASWQTGLAQKLGFDRIFSPEDKAETDSTRDDSVSPDDTDPELVRGGVADANNLKPHTSPAGLDGSTSANDIVPPILAYIHPSKPAAPLIRRVDTAQLLLAISLQLAKLPSVEEAEARGETASPFAHTKKVMYPEGVRGRTTITRPDSLVGENVMVDEKVSIKETVVGTNCQIKEGAKLFQCLLMDGVVVGKGCKLTRCILGKRSEIGDNCTLTDCEVQENLLVEPKTEDKNAKLMSSSGLEATEEEMQEVYQEFEADDAEKGDGIAAA
ncbi:Translation initiation factor eIF-2B subunit gamma [Cytospora mali]|uniref:Translation initiation factor eIF2B subunit gamma n=1 Tax=Cytospora mali TaxID=578113 RepID=A0A194UUD1_CYTMA|nr:Translation initiation factor eIF-2B subunit gamma [Valsa mali var. pyri (nom. inval.)]